MQKTICFVGGKSGGHIVPCLTLAKQYKDHSVLFFSTDAPLDQSLVGGHPIINTHITLPIGMLRRTHIYHYPYIAWNIFKSICMSIYKLYKHKPIKVISTGGLVGLPVCLAAKLLRIPVELYELNATPGKAAKVITAFADMIHVCFKNTQKYFPKNKCMISAYPIRFSHPIEKNDAYKKLGLNPDKKTIFIVGGSQGSLFLNKLIKQFIDNTHIENIQIIHQTGTSDTTNWQQWYQEQKISAYVFAYTNAINYCYAAADIIISRAGAGTLFEIQFFNTKSIIIPLKTKNTDHQYDNACAMVAQYPDLFTLVTQYEAEQNKINLFNIIHKQLAEINSKQK